MCIRDRGKTGHIAKIGIEAEPGANAAGDLADLQRVGQAGAWSIAIARADDLSFIGQAPQGCRMQHTGAVAGEYTAMFFHGMES